MEVYRKKRPNTYKHKKLDLKLSSKIQLAISTAKIESFFNPQIISIFFRFFFKYIIKNLGIQAVDNAKIGLNIPRCHPMGRSMVKAKAY